jgi:hypothetical protein
VYRQILLLRNYHDRGYATVVPTDGVIERGEDYHDTIDVFTAYRDAGTVPPKYIRAMLDVLDGVSTSFLGGVRMIPCKVHLTYKSPLRSVAATYGIVQLTRVARVIIDGTEMRGMSIQGLGLFGPPALDRHMGEFADKMRCEWVGEACCDVVDLFFEGVAFMPIGH